MQRKLNVNTTRKIGLAAALATALLVGGCGGDDDDEPVPVGNTLEVPESAGSSSAAFVGYIQGLGSSDEASEPLTIRDSFAVPADDDSEPPPLS